MYKILQKEVLSESIRLMVVEAPQVARKARAGQFIIVIADPHGERIPLTIADYDRKAGTLTIIFQEAGKSTMQMGAMEVGDSFNDIAGPLGNPTEIDNFGRVICVGGGVGTAPLYTIMRELKEAGNYVISIIGARTKELLFWEDKLRAVSNELIVTTDDGSYGRKALVTAPLKEILETQPGRIARIWAIGPAVMMKSVADATRPFNVPTVVSLNTIMVDGTGMCGGCRVLTEDGARFVCVDGPEFDAHRVDWNNLLSRMAFYRSEEQLSIQHWRESHTCGVEQAAVGGAK